MKKLNLNLAQQDKLKIFSECKCCSKWFDILSVFELYYVPDSFKLSELSDVLCADCEFGIYNDNMRDLSDRYLDV